MILTYIKNDKPVYTWASIERYDEAFDADTYSERVDKINEITMKIFEESKAQQTEDIEYLFRSESDGYFIQKKRLEQEEIIKKIVDKDLFGFYVSSPKIDVDKRLKEIYEKYEVTIKDDNTFLFHIDAINADAVLKLYCSNNELTCINLELQSKNIPFWFEIAEALTEKYIDDSSIIYNEFDIAKIKANDRKISIYGGGKDCWTTMRAIYDER